MPQVSVVMSVYNGAAYLTEAIESILAQTITDLELIVIDDGSTDGTADLLAGYQDPRMRVIRQENQGLARALNRGIRETSGQYIARMDDDDVSHAGRLAAQRDYLERHCRVGVVGTWFHVIDEEGAIVATNRPAADAYALTRDMAVSNLLCHSSVMLRRSALEAVGGYCEQLRYAQDYELWLRLVREGFQIGVVPDVLHRFRITSRAATKYKQQKRIAKQVKHGFLPSGEEDSPADTLSHKYRVALYHYAIGVAKLRGEGPVPARSLVRSLIYYPFHAQAWAWLGLSLLPHPVRTRLLQATGYSLAGARPDAKPSDEVRQCKT